MSWIMDFIKESNELSLAKEWRLYQRKKKSLRLQLSWVTFAFVENHNLQGF